VLGRIEWPPRHPDDPPNFGPGLECSHRGATNVASGTRDRDRELFDGHGLYADAIACAVRRARAMIVIIGFVPDALGKALASPIQTPGVSCSSP
jgi:hypothetical protein